MYYITTKPLHYLDISNWFDFILRLFILEHKSIHTAKIIVDVYKKKPSAQTNYILSALQKIEWFLHSEWLQDPIMHTKYAKNYCNKEANIKAYVKGIMAQVAVFQSVPVQVSERPFHCTTGCFQDQFVFLSVSHIRLHCSKAPDSESSLVHRTEHTI